MTSSCIGRIFFLQLVDIYCRTQCVTCLTKACRQAGFFSENIFYEMEIINHFPWWRSHCLGIGFICKQDSSECINLSLQHVFINPQALSDHVTDHQTSSPSWTSVKVRAAVRQQKYKRWTHWGLDNMAITLQVTFWGLFFYFNPHSTKGHTKICICEESMVPTMAWWLTGTKWRHLTLIN